MFNLFRKSYLNILSYRTSDLEMRYLGRKTVNETRFARFLSRLESVERLLRNDRDGLRVILKLICLIILLFAYLFISSFSSFGVCASVVLNEVAIQPNQVVELYNTASVSADISGWYIDDTGGITYYTIPQQTTLAPQSCSIFAADFNFNKSSADTVRLFDNTSPPTTTSAKLIESYSYLKAPETNYSFEKKFDGETEWQTNTSSLGLYNESFTSCIPTPTLTPTPTESPTIFPTNVLSSTPEPTQTPSPTLAPVDYQNIYISEVFPYPQPNEDEWIELFNNNDIQVNLDHWYIDDGENTGSTPKPFSLIMAPYSYAVVDPSSSLFNNTGDVARLLDSNKEEKDSMEYAKIVQGKSMGRISFEEDSYCEQEPSKNIVNMPCLLELAVPTPSQLKQNAIKPTRKTALSTKKTVSQMPQKINTFTNSFFPTLSPPEGKVLGAQIEEIVPISPTPYLSFVSASYSLLTIVSLFIKMKNA